MEERLRFVARLLQGEKMAVLWWEFDVAPQHRRQYRPPRTPKSHPER